MSTSPRRGIFYCGSAPINSSCGRGQTRRRTPPRPRASIACSGQFQQVRDEKAQAASSRNGRTPFGTHASVSPRRAQHTRNDGRPREPIPQPRPVAPPAAPGRATHPRQPRTPATDDASQNAPMQRATDAWPEAFMRCSCVARPVTAVNRLSEVAGAHYCTATAKRMQRRPHRATWEERVSRKCETMDGRPSTPLIDACGTRE